MIYSHTEIMVKAKGTLELIKVLIESNKKSHVLKRDEVGVRLCKRLLS